MSNKSAKQTKNNSQEKNNQITDLYTYDPSNMIFSGKIEAKIPNSPLTYNRMYISTKNEDGTIGDLIIQTEELFSFGVNENRDPVKQELTGYSLALCLYSNSDNPTDKEKEWKECFDKKIVATITNHLLENKDKLGFFDLEQANLKKFNPIYQQRDKKTNKIVEGKSPVLSPKLIENKKRGTIESVFYDPNGNDINPLTLIKKNCRATTLIKIEGIYNSGDKYTLQYKVYESEIRIVDRSIKPLRRKKPDLIGFDEDFKHSEEEDNNKAVLNELLNSEKTENKKESKPVITRKPSLEDDEDIVPPEKEPVPEPPKRKNRKVKNVKNDE
jgi:hypothetical protein